MALANRTSRLGSPATSDPLNNSYQTSLFEERAGSLSTLSGFQANNNGVVPSDGVALPTATPTTTTTSTTTTTTTSP